MRLRAGHGRLLVQPLDYEVHSVTTEDGVRCEAIVDEQTGLLMAPTLRPHVAIVIASDDADYRPGQRVIIQRAAGAYRMQWRGMDLQIVQLHEMCARCTAPRPRYPVLAVLDGDALSAGPGRLLVEPADRTGRSDVLEVVTANRPASRWGRCVDGPIEGRVLWADGTGAGFGLGPRWYHSLRLEDWCPRCGLAAGDVLAVCCSEFD